MAAGCVAVLSLKKCAAYRGIEGVADGFMAGLLLVMEQSFIEGQQAAVDTFSEHIPAWHQQGFNRPAFSGSSRAKLRARAHIGTYTCREEPEDKQPSRRDWHEVCPYLPRI